YQDYLDRMECQEWHDSPREWRYSPGRPMAADAAPLREERWEPWPRVGPESVRSYSDWIRAFQIVETDGSSRHLVKLPNHRVPEADIDNIGVWMAKALMLVEHFGASEVCLNGVHGFSKTQVPH